LEIYQATSAQATTQCLAWLIATGLSSGVIFFFSKCVATRDVVDVKLNCAMVRNSLLGLEAGLHYPHSLRGKDHFAFF